VADLRVNVIFDLGQSCLLLRVLIVHPIGNIKNCKIKMVILLNSEQDIFIVLFFFADCRKLPWNVCNNDFTNVYTKSSTIELGNLFLFL